MDIKSIIYTEIPGQDSIHNTQRSINIHSCMYYNFYYFKTLRFRKYNHSNL